MTTVLFGGGGTGGHLMPALAIADALVRADSSIEPVFIGSLRGIEARVLPKRRWQYELLPLEPLYRSAWWRNIGLPWSMFQSLRGIRRVLRLHDPGLVIGTGGYASGPVVWAAMGRGIPALLQEQNAHPGVATRRLAGRAAQIHLGFPEARSLLHPGPGTRVFDSGNPIERPPVPRPDRAKAKQSLGFDPAEALIFIMGGSQGAQPINRVIAGLLGAELVPSRSQIFWQTGAVAYESYRHWFQPGVIRIEPFVDPIASVYAAADIVVARAGAMTIAELAAWGLPSVLIPLPSAAANHQLANATAMAQAGAAVLVEQSTVTPNRLASTLTALLSDPAGMAGLGRAALARSRPDAADEIAAAALELVTKR